jgi:hypothetical protein
VRVSHGGLLCTFIVGYARGEINDAPIPASHSSSPAASIAAKVTPSTPGAPRLASASLGPVRGACRIRDAAQVVGAKKASGAGMKSGRTRARRAPLIEAKSEPVAGVPGQFQEPAWSAFCRSTVEEGCPCIGRAILYLANPTAQAMVEPSKSVVEMRDDNRDCGYLRAPRGSCDSGNY